MKITFFYFASVLSLVITRLNNTFDDIPKKLEYCQEQLKTLHQQIDTAKEQIDIPFEKEQELQTKSKRLSELNILLNMDKHENVIPDNEPDEDMDVHEKKGPLAMKGKQL